ncbi:MAG: hypothetical protein NC483_05630 [Ruminococcus sp.]|nr:hypothetical protein [Ruminococcus sp.]
MKIEKLRNKNSKKYFLCGLIMVVVLTVTVTFITSKANYRMTASIPLTEGKVTASPYDINIVALYLDNIEHDSNTIIPSGYKINEENSYCYKGTNKSNKDTNARVYTDELGNHSFSGISKSSKCILYLEKAIASNYHNMQDLLDNYYIYKKIRAKGTFNTAITGDISNTVYVAPDDNGYSYYFAGNPIDNWVEFGDYYWRIIRVNGDGSIRLIYQGRTKDEKGNKLEPQTTGEETTIGASIFNTNGGPNIGYWYNENDEDKPSTIYNNLNNWFINTSGLTNEKYLEKIDFNAGFCSDMRPSTSIKELNWNTGNPMYYGPAIRHTNSELPSYNCDNEYLYTYNKATIGNKKLEYPVGLITSDEFIYGAGTSYVSKTGNFLANQTGYWTISPFGYDTTYGTRFYYVDGNSSSGYLHYWHLGLNGRIKPVINLRSDVTLTGDGTISNPYKVS